MKTISSLFFLNSGLWKIIPGFQARSRCLFSGNLVTLKVMSCVLTLHATQCFRTSMNVRKGRAVRGSDYSPATVLSEEKDKLVPENWRDREKQTSKDYTKTTCTFSFHSENICKVSKQLKETCKRSCAHMFLLSIHFDSISCQKKRLSSQSRKSEKKLPKYYTKTICTSSFQFQNNRCKTVRGVAPTRNPLSVHFDSISYKKKRLTKQKKWEKIIKGLYPNHMHIFIPCRKHLQSFKTFHGKL